MISSTINGISERSSRGLFVWWMNINMQIEPAIGPFNFPIEIQSHAFSSQEIAGDVELMPEQKTLLSELWMKLI